MRTMIVKHLIIATGSGGDLKIPNIPGKEVYRGSVLHSTQFTSAKDYEGRKAVVVGAGNSGHDIAYDFSRHGWDVTMIQRSPTYVISGEAMARSLGERYNEHFPIEFADILGVALPFATQKRLLKASVAGIANGIDKELLDNLATAGFQTYLGPGGAGLQPLILEMAGGLYIDTGASQEIINGTIKVKGTPGLRKFTEEGVELEDGTVLEGDILVFATGFRHIRDSIKEVCGPDVAEKVGKVWGLDAEGDLQGVWRQTGHPRLWVAAGGLSQARMHSLHLALQIKAIEEGIIHDGRLPLE